MITARDIFLANQCLTRLSRLCVPFDGKMGTVLEFTTPKKETWERFKYLVKVIESFGKNLILAQKNFSDFPLPLIQFKNRP